MNQLPSIEPGNFLVDTFESLKRIGCALVLRTNHRSESDLIVHNAGLIVDRKIPEFSTERKFHLHRIEDLPKGAEDDVQNSKCLKL